MEHWEKRINQLPKDRTSEDFEADSILLKIDEEEYLENTSFTMINAFLLGGIIILLASSVFIGGGDKLWTFLLCSIPGVVVILYGLVAPKKEKRLSRLKDRVNISLPLFQDDFNWSFSRCVAVKNYFSVRDGDIDSHLVLKAHAEWSEKGGVLAEYNLEDMWSFTVWYMDKNRPLPPGTAFDPYRQKDFERRKAEGFPKPLYPSAIPTPEATKEQQAERERIGEW